MTQSGSKSAVYNIPAGTGFADALATGLLAETGGDPALLAAYRILLPTRRACRVLRDTFLRLSGGQPLLLPRLQPIGDVDEDELSLGGDLGGALAAYNDPDGPLALPPAISPLQRRLLLARLIMNMEAYSAAPDQALNLAGALGRLIDQIYTEGLDMADLAGLVPADFAVHWQITLEFLQILSQHWPEILAQRGVIDEADRRNRLLAALRRHWQANPPAGPIIAAGSTGSIPATAALLKTIASLPQGRVILPGLDQEMDQPSWDGLDDTHPQATLKALLGALELARSDILSWPYAAEPEGTDPSLTPPQQRRIDLAQRRMLASEMMRPACTAERWTALAAATNENDHAALVRTLDQVKRFDCDSPREEARLIAVLMREALEQPGRRVALVTPDRNLARRVAMACQRWGIALDDSAGQPLPQSTIGAFLRLVSAAAVTQLRPAALLALLHHKYCDTDPALVARLERAALRGPAPAPGLAALKARLPAGPAQQTLSTFIDDLGDRLAPFLALCDGKAHPFAALITAHLQCAEALARTNELWRGEDGEAAALFFADLRDHAAMMPAMSAAQYETALGALMSTVNVRPAFGTHPRLAILGQLEARLLQADLVILGGLNEGHWPPAPVADPWMSRPMRARYGLPSPERAVGLAAHDFIQGFCSGEVVMTRARRVDGTPAVPARWLQRLDTVLQALQISPLTLCPRRYLDFAAALDQAAGDPAPYERPAPAPPVETRPRSLYVTAVEQWMRDPYALYAKHILKLRKLQPLEDDADAAQRGTILHAALESFIRAHPDRLPDNAYDQLLAHGRDAFGDLLDQPRLWAFWWPRFERLAQWFISHEQEWRLLYRPAKLEAEGAATLTTASGDFTIRAKADRVDLTRQSGAQRGAAIIDYKTGTVPKPADIKDGFAPQMALEAVILEQGGFDDIEACPPAWLGFWRLSGAAVPGEIKLAGDDPEALSAAARDGLIGLVDLFSDPSVPYYSLPRPDKAPPAAWQDYAHLARVQEWAALGDNEDAEAAG